ncbi:MAG: hypothetical protein C0425_08975 [Chlorobiaceae bacterium]|nr:hypothetical protein [Chlorobiaceae bacterium]MBA4310455.1 hypothetical protein [Chlorobiaceae bacterium]
MNTENSKLFDEVEFNNWANRSGLIENEFYLISKYILNLSKEIKILEVGTGNGRIAFEIAKYNYPNINAIDLAQKLLDVASLKAVKEFPTLKFENMNAANLQYESKSFECVIALQQIISIIDNPNDRLMAIKECYRVLKKDGLFISSFLNINGRWYNPIVGYFSLILKKIKGESEFNSYKYLPWLKLGKKINLSYLYQKQSHVYCYEFDEIKSLVKEVGFNVIEIKTAEMIQKKSEKYLSGGMIYLVAKK